MKFYTRFIVSVLIFLITLTSMSPFFSQSNRVEAQTITAQRIFGNDRYLTAVEVAKTGWTQSETVVLARADGFADALAGAPLAYKFNAPVLLTLTSSLNKETKEEITRLKATKVLMLGGTQAISDTVYQEIQAMGLTVERIGGTDRYETAKLIADKLGPNPENKAVVVSGLNFPDALAISPFAARNGYPILLTDPANLPSATQAALQNITSVIVIGGTSVISEAVKAQLPAGNRVSGINRYATAAEILQLYSTASQKVFIATGQTYADALTGSALAAKTNSPILLVLNDALPTETKTALQEKGFSDIIILGGEKAVSKNVERLLQTGWTFKLGNEVLMEQNYDLIKGKKVGLITNQSGVNSSGLSTINVFANDPQINLTALYGPEHGIDGTAKAGAYVESYTHKTLGIPVYSLYGATRMPTEAMLKNVDVLVFDIQDIGARTYTYISTLNYCMVAAKKYNKPILVLDRPNPVGGLIVEGPVLEDKFKTFVGVDNLPMAHGMTVGELALFFNRSIGVNLTVIPMHGYIRNMIYQDTGLPWVQTSPNIPDLKSVFGYMATGLGEGTGIYQADKFKWIGGKGINAQKFASILNNAKLPGVIFIPEYQGEAGGVRLQITDYHTFNPAKSGFYALAYARTLNNFAVPKSGQAIVMFDKIMGTDKIGLYLEQKLSPQQIEANYTPRLNEFKKEREKYLIYGAE